LAELYDALARCGAGAKLLLMDACRNDAVRGTRRSGIDRVLPPPEGLGVLFSCSPGQVSFEAKDYKHGVFFHHVLRGLKGEAVNRKGAITWDSLRNYVKEEVPDDVAKLFGGSRQVPNSVENLAEVPALVRVAKLVVPE